MNHSSARIILSILALAILFPIGQVQAKTVDRNIKVTLSQREFGLCDPMQGALDWKLYDVTTTYIARIFNDSAGGVELPGDGATVPVGTKLRVTPDFANSQINYYATGGCNDSPIGKWYSGTIGITEAFPYGFAGVPAASVPDGFAKMYALANGELPVSVSGWTFDSGYDSSTASKIIVVKKPAISYTWTGGGCTGTTGNTCTVSAAGPLSVSINYATTYAGLPGGWLDNYNDYYAGSGCSASSPYCVAYFGFSSLGSIAPASLGFSVNIAAAPKASGSLTLTPNNCSIPAGSRTCNVSATWTTSNAASPRLVNTNTGSVLSTAASNGAGLSVAVSVPSTTLTLNDGSTVLDTKTATAKCASGSGWDTASGACKAGTATLTATPSSITAGDTATLSWTSSPVINNCSIADPSSGPPIAGNNNVNSSGSTPVNPTTNTTYTLICSGPNGVSATATASVAVTQVFKPDLTAGRVTTTTAVVGKKVTLSALVTNSGNASTAKGFTDLLQSATDATGANAKDIGTFSSVTLAAGASNTATFTYTFPAIGTTYVRVCADKRSMADVSGVIAESNENNNCGSPWTAITVTPPAVNFCASPSTINSGDSSHLFWSSSDATSCVGNGFSTGGATQSNPAYSSAGVCNSSSSGGVPVSPLTDTAYGVTCCVNASNPATCGSASQTVIVTHQGVSISATPSRVPNSGGSATVNWSASNVKSCTITGTDGYNSGKVDGDSSNTVTGSNTNSSVTAQTTYQITCAMLDNTTITKRAVVNIAAKFNEF